VIARRRSTGQALAEFALVLPIFAIVLFGIIDFGRYIYTSNALGNGTREGARAASVSIRPSPICDGLTRFACAEAVVESRSWGVPDGVIDPTVTCWRGNGIDSTLVQVTVSGQCTTGDFLRVYAETDFTLVTPLIAQFLGGQTITAETQVTVQ
jgi:Flp pilus assembly protein TadG